MAFYNRGKEIILNPSAVVSEAPGLLLSDIIRVALMRAAYTFDRDIAHTNWGSTGVSTNEIVATGYVADGDARELGTKTVTQNDTNDTADFDAADLTYTAIGNGTNDTFTQIILFREPDASPLDSNRDLIAHVAVSSTTTNGGDVTLVWASSPDAILQLTHVA